MTEWLRPKFQRTANTFLDEMPSNADPPDRVRASSRVSSYLGLSRPPTPSVSTGVCISKAPDAIYEKPSVDQMVEILKVAMMTKDSLEALHPQYNSSILHTLEAYSDMRAQLVEKDRIIEEMRHEHTRELTDFEESAARWRAKEEDYTFEMKKLEVLLANTEGGMEKVSMARTNSVLHAGSREKGSTSKKDNPETLAARFVLRKRRDLSKAFESTMLPPPLPQPQRRKTSGIEMYEKVPQVNELEKFPRPHLQTSDDLGLGLTQVNLDALEYDHIETDLGIAFESSESSTSASGSRSSSCNCKVREKPLPAIPITSASSKETLSLFSDALYGTQPPSSPWVEITSVDQVILPKKGFSYQPGDDSPEIFTTGELQRARAKQAPASSQRNLPGLNKLQTSQQDASSEVLQLSSRARPRRPRPQTFTSTSTSHSSQTETLQHREHTSDLDVSRAHSSASSIVTAIRDNSGRSSIASTHQNPSGRLKLNRHAESSNTATIAAARAIASNPESANGSNALPIRSENSSNSREDYRQQSNRRRSTEAYKPVSPVPEKTAVKAEGMSEPLRPSIDLKDGGSARQSQAPLENKQVHEPHKVQTDVVLERDLHARTLP